MRGKINMICKELCLEMDPILQLSWPFQRGSTVCAYLTSCNTHHRTCLRIIQQKNIPGKFQKDSKNIRVITRTSLVILMDQQSQRDRRMAQATTIPL